MHVQKQVITVIHNNEEEMKENLRLLEENEWSGNIRQRSNENNPKQLEDHHVALIDSDQFEASHPDTTYYRKRIKWQGETHYVKYILSTEHQKYPIRTNEMPENIIKTKQKGY